MRCRIGLRFLLCSSRIVCGPPVVVVYRGEFEVLM